MSDRPSLSPLALAGSRGAQLRRDELGDGLVRLRCWTRILRSAGMVSTPYLLDDVLIDTGFAHARGPLLDALAGATVRAIYLTHHHEDHPGNAGPLATRHGCSVFLRQPRLQWSEGVGEMPLYRRLYWGRPAPYTPTELPEVVETSRRRLRVVPTPGHSATQVALLDEHEGVVFVGDLYVSPGVAAVMRHEDPWQTVASLRRVAALEPARMLNGHGLDVPRPARRLRRKADRIEGAARRAVELRARGLGTTAIAHALFTGGWRRDRSFRWITAGEFHRRNFVRAAIAHAPDGAG